MSASIEESLGHIDTRLSLVEREVTDLAGGGRWLKGIAVTIVLAVISGSMAFAKLSHQMESLNLSKIEADVSTTLTVLGSHGVELEGIRVESARQRGVDDSFFQAMEARTADRFTNKEGLRLESRIQRLEDWRIEHDKHEARQQ